MTAISLRDVSKQYVKYVDTPALLSHATRLLRGAKHSKFWAVRDLNFEIDEGSSVGVIGHNGSGKSTTLQMLAGVTAPTLGEVRVRGRIAPLISVGVGFHPELTGRENVFINAAILGMSSRETQRKYDSIVAFAGVEDFLDTPIKFYSSGMTVRLGFAVSAHSDPDILLVDEVLAVGDMSFTLKCFDYMGELQRQGTTIVVVSHNLAAIERLCPRTIVMQSGRAIFDGPTIDGIAAYHEALLPVGDQPAAPTSTDPEHDVVDVTELQLVDDAGGNAARVDGGSRLRARLSLTARVPVQNPFVTVTVISPDGVPVYRERNILTPFPDLVPGRPATWEVDLLARLPTGSYSLSVSVCRAAATDSREAHDLFEDLAVLATPPAIRFYVSGRPGVRGVADLEGRFRVPDPDPAP